ncbi:MAG: phosphatase PAP2 family protein [Nocardioidaceae bacterium]
MTAQQCREAEAERSPVGTTPTAGATVASAGSKPVVRYWPSWLRRAFLSSWVVEIAVLLVLGVAYNIVRALPRTRAISAVSHAHDVFSLEGPVFGWLELPLNHWIEGVTPIAVASCYLYAVLHYAATPVVFLMSRRRGNWQYWRGYWALVLASGMAVGVYAFYPVAPPRLVPDLDIVDTMRVFSGYGWWGAAASAPRGIGDMTNQYAAMPSMHFGWSLWCAVQMWGFKARVWRVLAVLYPLVLAVIVLATGNHFLLDVLAGALCVLVAYAVVEPLGRLVSSGRASIGGESAAAGPVS